jgi:hypothetical protein
MPSDVLFGGTDAPVPTLRDAFAGAVGISLGAGDWRSSAAYNRLRTLLARAAATGGSGATLASWGIEVSDETAAAISALSSPSRTTPTTPGWHPRRH